ncbi:MAG: hypothetical protein GPJ54_18655 [Candidatus Heimdallarchaeota archaeon]|nr:hypothetical protein [Candidatus Heimdallarchaeota archaeon]
MRATKSSFNDTRRLVIYNPFAKELWMLNGHQLHSEILRLTDYATDSLKKHLKVRHRMKMVDPDESQEKFDFLLNLSKNPELAESLAASPKTTKKGKKVTKKAAKKATKKATKKVSKKSTEKDVEKPAKATTKRKPLPRVETSTIPQVSLPKPSTKSTLGIAKGDLHSDDDDAVQMVEEFQIAYIEASGGAKLLIEELESSISEGAGYDKLVDHIQLINELVKSKSSNSSARDQLAESIIGLTDALFPMPTKKPLKKSAKKVAKKTTKKAAKKATKKAAKKTTKKKKKTTKK